MPSYILIIAGIIFVWLIVISFILIRLTSHYQGLVKDVSQKDLISALNHLIAKSNTNEENHQSLLSRFEHEITENKKHLQKIGFKRFNPFTDTGGNQSFILSLLDENGDGIVVSSLHSRENTRLYAKQIQKGDSPDQELSKDEKEVVKESFK